MHTVLVDLETNHETWDEKVGQGELGTHAGPRGRKGQESWQGRDLGNNFRPR